MKLNKKIFLGSVLSLGVITVSSVTLPIVCQNSNNESGVNLYNVKNNNIKISNLSKEDISYIQNNANFALASKMMTNDETSLESSLIVLNNKTTINKNINLKIINGAKIVLNNLAQKKESISDVINRVNYYKSKLTPSQVNQAQSIIKSKTLSYSYGKSLISDDFSLQLLAYQDLANEPAKQVINNISGEMYGIAVTMATATAMQWAISVTEFCLWDWFGGIAAAVSAGVDTWGTIALWTDEAQWSKTAAAMSSGALTFVDWGLTIYDLSKYLDKLNEVKEAMNSAEAVDNTDSWSDAPAILLANTVFSAISILFDSIMFVLGNIR